MINQKAPEFVTQAYHVEEIKTIRLSNYSGHWVVLFFYPGDFTFVCPTELAELSTRYDEFKRLDCEVLSVSTDSVYVHKAWHDSSPVVKNVRFPMLSDTARKISSDYQVLIENEGVSLRGTFLIDPDGVIKAFEVHDNSIGRSADELLRKLEAAQFVRTHKGEVCPASWNKGSKTLKPGLDLVGKI